jgi:hypothetical protein
LLKRTHRIHADEKGELQCALGIFDNSDIKAGYIKNV